MVTSSGAIAAAAGTPARRAISLARILEPMSSIAWGGGPTHVSPAVRTSRANPAFSERKP